jgi:hypothetical protein
VAFNLRLMLLSFFVVCWQVRAHWAACRIHENSSQLLQLRDNLLKIINCINNMPGIMTQMPPLPVKLNIELASHILQTPMV